MRCDSAKKMIFQSGDDVASLRRRLNEAEDKIKQLRASFSWRITSPVRFVWDRLALGVRRIRRVLSRRSVRIPTIPQASEETIALLFDEEYYVSLNPQVGASRKTPIEHYREMGWKEGLKPHPLFDPVWYLKENPEVAKSGSEPLFDYATSGWREGRSPHPLFDVRYYLEQVPELYKIGLEPVSHFLQEGARKGVKATPTVRSDLVRKV